MNLSRRVFLKMALGSSGSLLLRMAPAHGAVEGGSATQLDLNPFIEIHADNRVTLTINKSEMGQGVETSLAQLLAEELEVHWEQIETRFAPVAAVYDDTETHLQTTGHSSSIRHSWEALRMMGATAREMLRQAAAKTWFVPLDECQAIDGTVVHTPSHRTFPYGELLTQAAALAIPTGVKLKSPDENRYIGQSIGRRDIPAKVNGSATFGIDISLPNLHTATVVHPPVFGATLLSVDDNEARKIADVVDIFPISRGVAVVAKGFWPAQQAARALKCQWQGGDTTTLDSESLRRHWTGLARDDGDEVRDDGDANEVLDQATHKLAAIYQLPYQAHATMEPMNCTVRLTESSCEVWAPTQAQSATREIAARITGLDREQVTVHTTYLGGGFGRRLETDFVTEATEIAMHSGLPIKLIWSREEDMQHDFYRPATCHVLKAALDDKGLPQAWKHLLIGPSAMPRLAKENVGAFMPDWTPGFVRDAAAWSAEQIMSWRDDPMLLEGAHIPYQIANIRLEITEHNPGVPVGLWRSVGNSHNAFVVESFLDEIAAAGHQDPMALRRQLLADQARSLAVLDELEKRADWTPGRAQGMALHHAYDSLCGMVVEVAVDNLDQVRVVRVVCVVDCGQVVNPDGIVAQIEGGIIFGLSATLKGQITLREGRVEQSNFHDFPLLTLPETPRIETYILPSKGQPGGIGELAVPPIAPAVCNAIFATTGKRVRNLPISPRDLARA